MRRARSARLVLAIGVAVPCLLAIAAGGGPSVQTRTGTIGRYYRFGAPDAFERTITAVRVERFAPHTLAGPAPIAPVPLPVRLQAFTEPVIELPEAGRAFVAATDTRGVARFLEIDLVRRQAREVEPSRFAGPGPALRALVAPDGSKVYVQWLGPRIDPPTDIYDGALLRWLDRTVEFRADLRALEYEHRRPWLWTFDPQDRLVLVDTRTDRIVRRIDPALQIGDERAVVVDAWRDLLLVRQAGTPARFRVLDSVSGEIGPPLEVAEEGPGIGRLTGNGRFLAWLRVDRRIPRRFSGPPLHTVTGDGALYDLRAQEAAAGFHLALPPGVPARALGTEPDPLVPGRLRVYGPGDRQDFDLGVPRCDDAGADGEPIRASVSMVREREGSGTRYAYRLSVSPESPSGAGAFAVQVGGAARGRRATGWGLDRLEEGSWVRWLNGLGPDTEDVPPGGSAHFHLEAEPGTYPGTVRYRVRPAPLPPRGCEREDRFLERGLAGWTIGPERLPEAAARRIERLADLVERACRLNWIEPEHCDPLTAAAEAIARDGDRAAAVTAFSGAVRDRLPENETRRMLIEAAEAVAVTPEGSDP